MLKWSSPGIRGVPDNIVFWPRGRVCLVEFKAKGGVLSFSQMGVRNMLAGRGHEVLTISTLEELNEFVSNYADRHNNLKLLEETQHGKRD